MAIVIIGAGIGGLTTALSLHAAGFPDIAVYERAERLRPLGVGINLLPHAVRELTELGLGERIEKLGAAPGTLAYYNRFGQPIWSEPRGLAAGYRWPQVSVHRGRLQMELLAAVEERLGPGTVRTGHHLLTVEAVAAAGGSGGVARFATAGGEVAVAAEVIVGADGMRSALRRQWYPDEDEPVWNGLTLWRGTARMPGFLDGRTMIMAGDAEQKLVAYPIGCPDADGNAEINFIAERRTHGLAGENADWNRAVDPRPIIDLFQDWRFPWLDVPALLAAAGEILEYPMVDRDPVDRWAHGHATLLGDAAHPMYPNGSNGASQAILDARTLAFHLATSATAAEGLAAYESARRPATTALVLSNRRQGPEQVMVLAHERAPRGFTHIHDVLTPDELTEIATGYKKAAGFHPDALNNRPSLTPPGALPSGAVDDRPSLIPPRVPGSTADGLVGEACGAGGEAGASLYGARP
ncbi:flavin-dependent oxidoreductase [Actinoplanes hulinensis]|uniref:Flavin-dependent oxidoreductase n=1 Tax=Actinoplanes hulinensis TaxID=1144547 RepID=A0ABS7B0U2_9ACTN|nr:flavin-dependent oxidoreductase [Actinoplanes hulinensis]MBW6434595.1 flavin-dependent oxidoreductase [Actinoplanes hulinensis]